MLLRYEKTGPRWEAESAEFTSLTKDGAGPAGAPSPDLGDAHVNLLYRSVLGPQEFSAELHEWADVETLTRLGQAALAATQLGNRTRWLWQSPEDSPPENIDRSARLHVAMPG